MRKKSYKMKSIKGILVLVFLLSVMKSNAQDNTVKWAFGLGASFIDFSDAQGFEGEGIAVQIPNLSLLRYLGKGFTVGAGMSLSGISKTKYLYSNNYHVTMMDFYAKYDFGLSEEKWVPNLIGGFGLLVKERYNRSISLNTGVGLTYWVLPKLGLNGKIVHRFVSGESNESIGSHTQFSGSLIVTFGESQGKRNIRRTGSGFTHN